MYSMLIYILLKIGKTLNSDKYRIVFIQRYFVLILVEIDLVVVEKMVFRKVVNDSIFTCLLCLILKSGMVRY